MNLIKKKFCRLMIVKRIKRYNIKIDLYTIRLAFEKSEGYYSDSFISLLKQRELEKNIESYKRGINRLLKIYIKYI